MKILHYIPGFPPVRGGGLVKYALDLIEAESKKNDVVILAPGPISHNPAKRTKVSIRYAGKWKGIPKYKIINPLPIPMANGIQDILWFTLPCDIRPYQQFLKNTKPDLIHLHTFMGVHSEFLKEAVHNRIPVVYTTHDYFGICPKTDLMYGLEPCPQPGKHCAECSRYAFSPKRLILEQSDLYEFYRNSSLLVKLFQKKRFTNKFLNIRSSQPIISSSEIKFDTQKLPEINTKKQENYEYLLSYYISMFFLITRFHFNSNMARNVYEKFLGKLNGQVINISNKAVTDQRTIRTQCKCLRLGYLGGDSPYKGLRRLLSIINVLYDKGYNNLELHLYGCKEVNEYPFCKYHNSYNNNLKEVFNSMDILAVPSIWEETFGMVVVEALSFAVPVIISEKVGAKDILDKSKKPLGIIIPDSDQAWLDTLIKIYTNKEIIKHMNENICNAALDFRYEKHLNNILEFYQETIEFYHKSSIVKS